MKKLPIGISTFKKIVDGNYVYVDKTHIALDLIENGGGYYFLSRPRRFGKSLFLDTLRTIFDGDKELFKGLYIYDKWEFEKYPVITLTMSDKFLILNDLENNIKNQLNENAGKYNIELEDNKPHFMLSRLLRELHKKTSKKVVLLIDDADAPFRERLFDDNLKEIHNFLLGFYITTKGCDEHIKFSMMMGIHPIKGDMLFGFNHFMDITLHPKYATICGYTQSDVETVFAKHLEGQDFDKIKHWYNGYKFLGEGVYNPFDILLFISNGFIYDNYWFSTATPTFLLKLMEKNNYFLPNLENIVKDEKMLDSFDVDYIELETLMWQTGYLTIDEKIDLYGEIRYKLAIPNQEVKISLLGSFADFLTQNNSPQNKDGIKVALFETNFANLEKYTKALFASIAYNNFTGVKLYEYEGYYISVFYAYIKAMGIELIAEDVINKGRIDLTIKLPNTIFVMEFKVDGTNALEQIKEMKYYEKYLSDGRDIYLVGMEFDTKDRNISKLEWETIRIHG